ncbi:MAG: hypothetical protein GX548_10680 [Lentisphaerae bacterium]|nr:hypothetical protein [Lentisphaerota bacterium]
MNLNHLLESARSETLWSTPDLGRAEVRHVIASDLMSDVLMVDIDHPLLLTSLVSDQALRTAHVVGAAGVLIANGKTPPDDMLDLARELGIPLARTPLSKFDAAVALGKALGK